MDFGSCWSGLTDGGVKRPAAERLEVSVTSEGERLQRSVRSEVLQPEASAAVLLTELRQRQQVQRSPVRFYNTQSRQVESTWRLHQILLSAG